MKFLFDNKLCLINNDAVLLDGMKFQWPRTPEEVKEVTHQQLKWLLDGLSIEQKKAHHEVKMSSQNSCY